MEKDEIIAKLRRDLERVAEERRSVRDDPGRLAARMAIRRFQSERMARTHADLLASAETRPAAEFFLRDLYGPHDLTERDANLLRALPTAERLLPVTALAGIAEAIALDVLSERLDAGMADRLGTSFSEAEYAEAYRAVGSRAQRDEQLQHVERLGAVLTRLVRIPLIGKTLAMMKRPAQLAGIGQLQCFLERGFSAFQAMSAPQEFVVTVVERERRIMDRLYSGEKAPFTLP
jgi:hypothetical protein